MGETWYAKEKSMGGSCMQLTQTILEYIRSHEQEAIELLTELAQIPAPSHHEEKRAAFCKNWLEQQGAKGVYIDDAQNVVYPIGCTEGKKIAVFMAHSDVVFPDMDALPLTAQNGRIHCPGVCDDTANIVAMLMAAKYIAERELQPRKQGVLLVVNSCEEGLGNLKGCRKIMEDYGDHIAEFVTFDDKNGKGVHKAVGSRRYCVKIDTEGGHSYSDFGNRNAIACLASLIEALYSIEVPAIGKTTYNVGTISGGTTVNTIAQHAEMLYEFRSDEREAMLYMERKFEETVARFREIGLQINVTIVGDRPCGGEVDARRMADLMARADAASLRANGRPVHFKAGSTDCNIPLSMGIPSICVGCCDGDGCHTREEYLDLSGVYPGLCMAFDMILHHF